MERREGLGMGIMDWEDFLVSNNLLPIGSMIYLLFCCVSKKYGWGYDHFLEEANQAEASASPPSSASTSSTSCPSLCSSSSSWATCQDHDVGGLA